MIGEGNGSGESTSQQAARTSTDRVYPRSPPMSPASKNRFIVEPQVLNAAFELEMNGRRDYAPSLPPAGGGLPPPPRPNSRKGKPPRSTPPSPATSIDHSIASLPNSPTSSPYSNSPNTPASTDGSPSQNPNAKPSPRLSNFLRGDSLVFSARRRSLVEHDGLYDQKEGEPVMQTATLQTWAERDLGDPISPLDSVPSSPELTAHPADGSRPSRQNRYLSGLQKITKLGRGKGSLSAVSESGARSARRMSDAELDPRRSSVERASLPGRYRRILEKGASKSQGAGASAAGELKKQPSSVPSSPVAPAGKSIDGGSYGERRRMSFRRPSVGGSGPSGGRWMETETECDELQPPPRAWVSHARQASEQSTSSSLASAALSLSPASASDSSHDPQSSLTDARISISSTIYPSSSNNHSFDIARYPHPGRSSMSADRESFIDLASPTFSPFSAEFQSIPQLGQNATTQQPTPQTSNDTSNDFNHGEYPSRSTKPRLPRLIPPAGSEKPPIPTTPKPDFSRRSRSSQPSASRSSRGSPVQTKQGGPLSTFPGDLDRSLSGLSTTNALNPRERAQRVRQTHKLTQLFGQTPGVSPISPERQDAHLPNGCMPIPGNLALNLTAKRKHPHHRPAVSMSEEVVAAGGSDTVWPPPDSTRYVSLAARRHSAPLSPDDFSLVGRRSNESGSSAAAVSSSAGHHDGSAVIEIGTAEDVPQSDAGSGRWTGGAAPGSPTSFMDLSDEEGAGDGISEILAETPRGPRTRRGEYGASTASLSDSLSLSSEQLAEEERRRKREKLAKLHRFLGSRVPQHLVLGTLDEGTPLPPPAPAITLDQQTDDDADARKIKMRRRRSSSAAEFSRTWSDDIDRLKEELNEREKAINVRRAVKMEKMFGVAPPQTLYHTRAPTSSSSSLSANSKAPPSPRASPRSPSSPAFRFTQSGSGSKPKKKNARPGTSDSSKPLIGDSADSDLLDPARSSVYMHYRHSLNSLNDIIDRDDRESLAELHDYLSSHPYTDHPHAGPSSPLAADDQFVATPTAKSERRRSLPSRTSIASFTSEISLIIAPTPTEPSFQQRRRRAAKLTHFFGVDYRELMNEVLESIEKGLEEERGKGTLRPDEVKDLQQKLVSLKTKRNSLRQ
ncbi:hypothetical protein BV20DRAFT_960642 [Pilatotrama ljubarskyi]|nr:hypothetical protein BV20DRAFT_960642 [Pilatotrama ljubarskyi]